MPVISQIIEFENPDQAYACGLIHDIGKLVKIKDDLMSATRYAVMSLRHSTTETSKWNRKGTLGPDVAIV